MAEGLRCAVLGDPVAHSLSPAMHTRAYDLLGLNWTYACCRVPAGGLAGFVAGLDDRWRGLSLTMPLKREALALVDQASDTARATGAVNTVLFGAPGRPAAVGSPRPLHGHNTDVPGLVDSLDGAGVRRCERALLVGAGATAESAVTALAGIGLRELCLVVRDRDRAEPLRRRVEALDVSVDLRLIEELSTRPPSIVDVIVSTVPGAVAAALPDLVLRGSAVVFDLVYDPWPSPLLERASVLGRPVLSGIDLLAHQAARQVLLMTGAAVPVDALRDAALVALGNRSRVFDV